MTRFVSARQCFKLQLNLFLLFNFRGPESGVIIIIMDGTALNWYCGSVNLCALFLMFAHSASDLCAVRMIVYIATVNICMGHTVH